MHPDIRRRRSRGHLPPAASCRRLANNLRSGGSLPRNPASGAGATFANDEARFRSAHRPPFARPLMLEADPHAIAAPRVKKYSRSIGTDVVERSRRCLDSDRRVLPTSVARGALEVFRLSAQQHTQSGVQWEADEGSRRPRAVSHRPRCDGPIRSVARGRFFFFRVCFTQSLGIEKA